MIPSRKKPKDEQQNKFKLLEYIPYKLSMIAERSSYLLASQYKLFGISRPQFRVMAFVNTYPHTSSTRVANETLMDKSRVARAIETLIERGLIAREINPADKRANLLDLTPKGEELYAKISVLAMNIQRRLGTSLTQEENRIFNNVLIKLDGALNQLEAENTMPRTD